jgi:hypothetical protein
MFKKSLIFLVLGVLILGGFLTGEVKAQICGDVDADGMIAIGDVLWLTNYLLSGGPPPLNMCNADMDNNPGVDLGDLMQLIGFIYGMCPGPLFCCFNAPMNDAPGPAGFDFYTGSFLASQAGATLPIFFVNNCAPPIFAISFPFSYAPVCGLAQTNVTLNSITVGPLPPGWASGSFFNNATQRGWIYAYNQTFTTPLPNGAFATLNYTSGPGIDAWLTESIYPPRHTLFGLTTMCYSMGMPQGRRVITPRALFYIDGDVNCDGVCDIGDIVYLINYVFYGGAGPCTDWQ